MNQEIKTFLFEALRPQCFLSDPDGLPRPEWVHDVSAWDRLFQTAQKHGSLIPILLTVDRSLWVKEVPPVIRAKMNERIERAELQSVLVESDHQILAHELSRSQIPFIAVGETDIRRRFYPERIYRPIQFMECVVSNEDFVSAMRVVGRVGYRLVEPFVEGKDQIQLTRRPSAPGLTLTRKWVGGLHSDEMAGVWDRARPSHSSDLPPRAKVLAPVDCFLKMIFEISERGGLPSLSAMTDLFLVVQSSPDVFGPISMQILEKNKARSTAWVVLRVLNQTWGLKLDEKWMAELGEEVHGMRKRMVKPISSTEKWFDRQSSDHFLQRVESRVLLGRKILEAVQEEWADRRNHASQALTLSSLLGSEFKNP